MSPSPLNRSSGLPLRANSPAPLEHPQLREVKTLRESLAQGSIKSTSGAIEKGSINITKHVLQLIESNSLIESSDNLPAPERAACVPDTCFVRVSAVLAAMAPVQRKTVRIPATAQHEGFYSTTVTLDWVCPVCGGPRGEIFDTISYDGSRRLAVHGWRNPCGHVDYYDNVRDEAVQS